MLSSIVIIDKKEENKDKKIEKYLSFYIQNHYKKNKKEEIAFIFLGEGSNLASSLAPTIGEKLKEEYPNVKIFGTKKDPVGLYNIEEVGLRDYLVVSVDSLLSKEDEVGNIVIETNSLFPSVSVSKTNRIGDIRVGAIIGDKNNIVDLDSLSRVDACIAVELGQVIEKSIRSCIKKLTLE